MIYRILLALCLTLGGAMLFDQQNDSNELKNLVIDPADARTVKEMKKHMAPMPK